MMALIIVFIILVINNALTISSSGQAKASFFCVCRKLHFTQKNRHFSLPLSMALGARKNMSPLQQKNVHFSFIAENNLASSDTDIFFVVHSTDPSTESIKEEKMKKIAFSLFSQLRNKANIRLIRLKQKTTKIENER